MSHRDGSANCWGAVGPDFGDITVGHVPQPIDIADAIDVELLGAWLTSC